MFDSAVHDGQTGAGLEQDKGRHQQDADQSYRAAQHGSLPERNIMQPNGREESPDFPQYTRDMGEPNQYQRNPQDLAR